MRWYDMEGVGVSHPKGNATPCQLSSEGQTRVVLVFNPTSGRLWSEGWQQGGGLWRSYHGVKGTSREKGGAWWSFSHNERKEERRANFLNDVLLETRCKIKRICRWSQQFFSCWSEHGLLKAGQRETACSYLTQVGLSVWMSCRICEWKCNVITKERWIQTTGLRRGGNLLKLDTIKAKTQFHPTVGSSGDRHKQD